MVCCAVPLCKSKKGVSNRSISFHEFPANVALREKWLENIARGPDPGMNEPWRPSDHSTVCSRHFTAEDFSIGAKRKILRRGAIPTVFEDYPEYLRPPVTAPRPPLTTHPVEAGNKRKRSPSPREQGVPHPPDVTRPKSPPGGNKSSRSACTYVAPGERLQQPEAAQEAPSVKSVSCGTVLSHKDISRMHTRIQTLERKCRREKAKVRQMDDRLQSMSGDLRNAQQKLSMYNIPVLEQKLEDQEPCALFLKEQLMALHKTKPRWTEQTIQHAVLWHAQSPAAYHFVRNSKLLSLPCPVTLKRYVGSCTEVVVSSLLEEGPAEETEQHSLHALNGSYLLETDETSQQ
ncbi:THAP domain-containing protein 1-like [Ornithodoros turicata]|uniref:THAP domain-containing protein 1-like n=1 Tax=Ornithodoros turicata TaxID=34597 RepID=UPI003138D894